MLGINRMILGSSASETPAAIKDAVVYGPIQSRTIGAGLTTRDDFEAIHFRNHTQSASTLATPSLRRAFECRQNK